MKNLLILPLCLLWSLGAFAWGQKGHDVTAYIAECHLTPQAAKKIDKVLGGHSMVYYANWLDIASHRPAYAYTKTWHYLNVDEGYTVETMKKNSNGDVLEAVKSISAKLKAGGLTPEEEMLNLKMLIHLVGDMHCPVHLGRLSDLGGNKRSVKVFNRSTSMHSAWDTSIVEDAHRWSYTEWQQQTDRMSDMQIREIQSGDLVDWINETFAICQDVYEKTPEGTNISYDYVDAATLVIELQFLRGGYRLAYLLNEIYK